MSESRRIIHEQSPDTGSSPSYTQSPPRAIRANIYPTSQSQNLDPLLEDLSPTKTLGVFLAQTDGDAVPSKGANGNLGGNGTQAVSTTEKAFGVRCAQAAKQLRAWCQELEAWDWPDTFEVPSHGQHAAKRRRVNAPEIREEREDSDRWGEVRGTGHHPSSEASKALDNDHEELFWGSLPAQRAQRRERHVDEIQGRLDDMDVEELKNHVLDVHVPSRSRSSSVSGAGQIAALSTEHFRRLDDYTALVTATIIQALPYLSRLTRLLHLWSTRLAVLRTSSSFLPRLKDAQSALHVAYSLIDGNEDSVSSSTLSLRESFNRDAFDTIQSDLYEKVTVLGQLLDRMLDDLEGWEDAIPDRWIDEFEALEVRYSSWVAEAGRCVLDTEARTSTVSRRPQLPDRMLGGFVDAESHASQEWVTAPQRNASEEPGHDTKHDTLTEPLGISVEIANKHGNCEALKHERDYILGAALSSHPPSNPPSATYACADTLPPLLTTTETSSQMPSDQSNLPILSSTTKDSDPSSRFDVDVKQADIAVHELEPKTLVQDSTNQITAPGTGGRRQLSAKLNALMGKEERPPTMRATNTPVRPFERANSGFGRLFNKRKESSESVEKSVLESRKQSYALARPRSNRSSPPIEREAVASEIKEPSGKVLDERKDTREVGRQRIDDIDISPQSTSPTNHSPYSALQKDLSDIQRAADLLETEQQPPSGKLMEEFVARPVSDPNAQYFNQGHRPLESPTPGSNELEETFEPDAPVATDDFYNKFVDSLPTTNRWEKGVRPGLNDRLFSLQTPKSTEPLLQSRQTDPPPPLTKRHTSQGLMHAENESSDAIFPPFTKPELADASLIGTSNPRKVSLSQISSFEENAGTGTKIEARRDSEDRASQSRVEVQQVAHPRPGSAPVKGNLEKSAVNTISEKPVRQPIFKRASIASIESFPRSEACSIMKRPRCCNLLTSMQLKSVQIRRTDSQGSKDSRSAPPTPVSPIMSSDHEYTLQLSQPSPVTSPQKDNVLVSRRPSNHMRSLSTTEEEESATVWHVSDLVKTSSPSPSKVPEQLASANSASQSHIQTASDPLENQADSPSISPTVHRDRFKDRTQMRPLSEDEQLERQISSILTTISARIRLISGPTEEHVEPKSHPRVKRLATAPNPLTTAKTRSVHGASSSTVTTPNADSSTAPTLTLHPAKPNATSRTYSGSYAYPSSHIDSYSSSPSPDTGVKLYHLHQPGRADPIRLFVRRVGGGSGDNPARVMVRVGGGWADLGDYLREFAQHHGRRTVSAESRVEMVGIDGAVGGSGRTASGGVLKAAPTTPATGGAIRPGSAGGSSVDGTKMRAAPSPGTPTPGPAVEADEVVRVREVTPNSTGSLRVRILEDDEQARVSLSGPVTKREMSAEKQKWVQDMLGQARKVSSERVERVGGTRRIAFRGLSSANVGTSAKEERSDGQV